MDVLDKYYTKFVELFRLSIQWTIPYLRRFIRFLALPYAYFILVNWNECTASRYQVFKDFLYIFFKLKDFPDYYTLFRFWEKDRSEWKYYYGSIYNPYQRGKLRKEVQKKEYEILFEDKYVCNQLCANSNLPTPDFLGYIEPSDNVTNFIGQLFKDEQNKKIIIKASRGKGGKDIYLAYKDDGQIVISSPNDKIAIKDFKLAKPSIVQRYIQQHPKLEKISSSVNTIRTETMLTQNNEVIIIGAFMRFGLDNNFLDNQCAGGLSIGVNINSGTLYEFAMNGKGEKFYSHPNTGVEFKDYMIPYWDKVIELSEKIQRYFCYFKLIGPDIGITLEGPVIIEINATPDHAGLEMDYGPVLREKKVWEAFKKYDLLINGPSKNLF